MNRLLEGYRLGERYHLRRRIASGGMGDVWEADDEVLERVVAVKILRPTTDAEETFAMRFRSEALYTANLCHSNIATVFDYGEDDVLAYLVMELVPGEPLSSLLQREGPLDPERVRGIMGQAALALGAAHESGVVHRDVKPANILVAPDGTVKLTDFGIARAVDGANQTQTGEVLGTPHYLSPEQALGESATGASDIYALGVVAHEMLTGRRPFDKGTPVATALAQVHEPPPPLPRSVPVGLRRLVEQCLAKRPEDRPRSARELGERLGLPESELVDEPVVPAAELLGAAEAAEDAANAAGGGTDPRSGVLAGVPAGGSRLGTDPTPTPPSLGPAPAAAPRHVHWAWVPAVAVLTLVVGFLGMTLAR